MEGRYLLGITSVAESEAFLISQAGLTLDERALAARHAATAALRAARGAESLWPALQPPPARWQEHLARVRQRALFQRLFASRTWHFAAVPVSALLTVQPYLHATYALKRGAAVADDAGLLEACLPVAPEGLELWGGASEGEVPSASFFTRDPNVRITAAVVERQPHLQVTFSIGKTAVFLQATRLGSRLYLKNGTHRALGLAARGIDLLPCVVVDANDDEDLPRILRPSVLTGAQPPRLVEFLDPDYYLSYPWQDRVKFIRLVPEEFSTALPDPG